MEYVLVRDTIIRKKDIIDVHLKKSKSESYCCGEKLEYFYAFLTIVTEKKKYDFNYNDKEGIQQAEIDFMQLFKDLNEK